MPEAVVASTPEFLGARRLSRWAHRRIRDADSETKVEVQTGLLDRARSTGEGTKTSGKIVVKKQVKGR